MVTMLFFCRCLSPGFGPVAWAGSADEVNPIPAPGPDTPAGPIVRVLLKDGVSSLVAETAVGWLVLWPNESVPDILSLSPSPLAGPVASPAAMPLEATRLHLRLVDGMVRLEAEETYNSFGPSKRWLVLIPQPSGEPFSIDGVPYRGTLAVIAGAGGLRAVNLVPLEEYLRGVVPLELGVNQLEALKAQAVVARTYALARIGAGVSDQYDLTSDVGSQAYGGMKVERPYIDQAIAATAGQILTWNGRPARETLYHSTCGGHTAPADAVFGGDPVPYLEGVPCSQAATPMPCPAASPSPADEIVAPGEGPTGDAVELSAEGFAWDDETDAFCAQSSLFRWQVRLEPAQLAAVLARTPAGQGVGDPVALNVIRRDSSGRVEVLEIQGSRGSLRLEGDAIRGLLRYADEEGREHNLYSTRFLVQTDPQGGWRLLGAGWGHGVGMCQWGAVGMARKGFSCPEILGHYYPGTSLQVPGQTPADATNSAPPP